MSDEAGLPNASNRLIQPDAQCGVIARLMSMDRGSPEAIESVNVAAGLAVRAGCDWWGVQPLAPQGAGVMQFAGAANPDTPPALVRHVMNIALGLRDADANIAFRPYMGFANGPTRSHRIDPKHPYVGQERTWLSVCGAKSIFLDACGGPEWDSWATWMSVWLGVEVWREPGRVPAVIDHEALIGQYGRFVARLGHKIMPAGVRGMTVVNGLRFAVLWQDAEFYDDQGTAYSAGLNGFDIAVMAPMRWQSPLFERSLNLIEAWKHGRAEKRQKNSGTETAQEEPVNDA